MHLAYDLLDATTPWCWSTRCPAGDAPGDGHGARGRRRTTSARASSTRTAWTRRRCWPASSALGGTLPPTYVVGCRPRHVDEGIGLSAAGRRRRRPRPSPPSATARRLARCDRREGGGLTCASASPDRWSSWSTATPASSRWSTSRARSARSTSACSTRRRRPGDWVLIHMGFAVEVIDAGAAAEALAGLELMGQRPRRRTGVRRRRYDGGRRRAGRRLPAVRLRHRRRAGPDRLGGQHRDRRGRRGRGRRRTRCGSSAGGCAADAPPLAVVEAVDESRAAGRGRHRLHHRRRPARGGPARTLASPDVATCARLPRRAAPTRPTAATGTRSSPAPTAARASPSSPACRTTGRPPRWPAFAMCAACRARVRRPGRPALPRPADRLPRLRPAAGAGPRPAGEPAARRDALRARPASCSPPGAIVAVKGLGGYHLACDARDEAAVAELRRRKQRGGQAVRGDGRRPRRRPRGWSTIDADEERAADRHPRAPIVLLPAPAPAPASPTRSRRATPTSGVMLPYTPLHELLLGLDGDPAGPDALVMTSGNLSGEPIVTDDAEALRPAGAARRRLAAPRPADPRAVRRLGRAGRRRRRAAGPPVPRLRAAAGRAAVRGAADAGRRRRPEEHLRAGRGPVRLAQPARRRHGRPRHPRRARPRPSGTSSGSPAYGPSVLVADAHPAYRSTGWAREHAAGRPVRPCSTTTRTSPRCMAEHGSAPASR